MRTSVFSGAIMFFLSALCHAGEPQFKDVVIDKEFRPYLQRNKLLMEVTGAKVIKTADGASVLLAVSSTVLKDDSSKERLRAEKVCRSKALAAMVAEKKGIQVCHVETLNEKTEVIIDDTEESGTSISELIQVTQTKVEGYTKDMPVVGRWRSRDGSVYYLAIGCFIDKNGDPVPSDESSPIE